MTTAYALPQVGDWVERPASEVVVIDTSDPSVTAEMIEGLPARLVETYAAMATRHAIVREVDPGVWVASVVGLDGAWAEGDAPDAAIAALPETIVSWVALKLHAHARDIPVIDGLDLNPRESE